MLSQSGPVPEAIAAVSLTSYSCGTATYSTLAPAFSLRKVVSTSLSSSTRGTWLWPQKVTSAVAGAPAGLAAAGVDAGAAAAAGLVGSAAAGLASAAGFGASAGLAGAAVGGALPPQAASTSAPAPAPASVRMSRRLSRDRIAYFLLRLDQCLLRGLDQPRLDALPEHRSAGLVAALDQRPVGHQVAGRVVSVGQHPRTRNWTARLDLCSG